jgi:hydroxymethylpyrimidine pyrophosphatase-like HAD family hydrolase
MRRVDEPGDAGAVKAPTRRELPHASSIELVVTDLDGTLWHSDRDIPPAVVDALERLTRQGMPLLVATGRRVASTRRPLAGVGLAPPAVVLNGALGLDLSSGERFHRAPFPREEALATFEAFQEAGLDPVVYVDHVRYEAFLSASPSTHPGHVEGLGTGAGVDDLARVVAEEAVLGFGLIGVPHGDVAPVATVLDETVETHLDRSLDYPGMASLTVAPRGQSKWDGVTAFCAREGLRPDRVLAVADGPNDLELLAHAAVRVVPDDAHPAAAELADHVIDSSRLGGWAAVPDLLG